MPRMLKKLVVEWTESSRTQISRLLVACWKTAENSGWICAWSNSFMAWESHHGWQKLYSSFVMNLPRKKQCVFAVRSLLYNEKVCVCEVRIPRGVLEIKLKKYPEKEKNCLGRYCTAFFLLRAEHILKNMSCGVKNEEKGLQSALILLRFLCDLQIPLLIKSERHKCSPPGQT